LKCEQINGCWTRPAEVWERPLEARLAKSRNDGASQLSVHFRAEIFHCEARLKLSSQPEFPKILGPTDYLFENIGSDHDWRNKYMKSGSVSEWQLLAEAV
jgi:hypothetical protein